MKINQDWRVVYRWLLSEHSFYWACPVVSQLVKYPVIRHCLDDSRPSCSLCILGWGGHSTNRHSSEMWAKLRMRVYRSDKKSDGPCALLLSSPVKIIFQWDRNGYGTATRNAVVYTVEVKCWSLGRFSTFHLAPNTPVECLTRLQCVDFLLSSDDPNTRYVCIPITLSLSPSCDVKSYCI